MGSYAGRLIIPASNRIGSYTIFSDDHGITWNYGANVGYGNEHEVLLLENGTFSIEPQLLVKNFTRFRLIEI